MHKDFNMSGLLALVNDSLCVSDVPQVDGKGKNNSKRGQNYIKMFATRLINLSSKMPNYHTE